MKKNNFLNCLVVSALAFALAYFLFGSKARIEYVEKKDSGMQAGEKEQINFRFDELKIKKDIGEEKATIQTVYVPREGGVTIKTPKENEEIKISVADKIGSQIIKEDDGRVIIIKNKGFIFRPGVSVSYADEFVVGGQARLFYWNRFGAGAGYDTENTLYGYGDYILPYLNNTAAGVKVGRNNKETVIGAFVAVYLW